MSKLLERAISTEDADRAAKIIQDPLGIESNEVANYCFPKTGRGIASSPRGSSVIGWRPKCGSWPEFLVHCKPAMNPTAKGDTAPHD